MTPASMMAGLAMAAGSTVAALTSAAISSRGQRFS
jgi:hypothetical protein